MARPDVSVVVPTHNRPGWLVHTLCTVLDQRGVELEVVVVDDGSDVPGTAEAIAAVGDDRVRLVRHEVPLGACASRNAGAAVARAPVLAFCDDDDVWAPDKLARQLAALEASAATWAYAGAVDVDAGNEVLRGNPPPSPDAVCAGIDRANLLPAGASNVVVRADRFREVGGFDVTLRHVGDWDLWRRLARLGAPAAVDEPLVGYRQHGGNDNRAIRSILRETRAWSRRAGVDVGWGGLYVFYSDVAALDGRRRTAAVLAVRGALAGDVKRAARRLRRGLRAPPAVSEPSAYQAAATRWLAALPRASDAQPPNQRDS